MTRGVAVALLLAIAPVAVVAEPVSLAARVEARRDVEVPAEVAGRVTERLEDESATVQRGDVVVTLDPVFARLLSLAAEAAARREKARLEWAKLELERARRLAGADSIGEAELDRAQLQLTEIGEALASAEATAEELRTRLERTKIRAPFDGRLVRIHPEAGEYLRVGEPAFRIVDDAELKVIVYLPGALLRHVAPGSRLAVAPEGSDASPADLPRLEARVVSVAPAAEGPSRTFRVEARLQDVSGRWRPGMTARIELPDGAPTGEG